MIRIGRHWIQKADSLCHLNEHVQRASIVRRACDAMSVGWSVGGFVDSLGPTLANKTKFVKAAVGETQEELLPPWLVAVQTGSFVIVCVLALGGNGLVALTLLKRDQLIIPSNKLVFSLTASNFALALVVFPFAVVSSLQQKWVFGIFWCNFTAFLTVLIATASLLTIGVIAIDRYYAIVKPMMYTLTITNARSSLMLLSVWLLGFVCSLPPLFGWSRFHYRHFEGVCLVDWHYDIYYTSFVLLLSYAVPFVTMIVCYYFIFQVARTKTRKIHVGTLSKAPLDLIAPVSAKRSSHRWSLHHKPSWYLLSYSSSKGVRTICLVMGVFIGTCLPYLGLGMAEAKDSTVHPAWLHVLALGLAFFSTASHPIVYGLYNRSIRKEIKAYLRPSKSRVRHMSRGGSRRISISGSILDYTPLKLYRPGQSRRRSADATASLELSSQNLVTPSPRRGSQDSGAIMNESDSDAENQLWGLQRWRRRVSAPSRLQNSLQSGQLQESESSHPLPILNTLNAELNNSRARKSVEARLRDTKDIPSHTCIVIHESSPSSSSTALPIIEDVQSPSVASKVEVTPPCADEGIVDCVIEDLT